MGWPESFIGGGVSPINFLMANPAGRRLARACSGAGLMTQTRLGPGVWGVPDPGVGPVATVGGGRPRPEAMEGVKPEVREEVVEREESVSAGKGGSLRSWGCTSCSRVAGRHGKWNI
jgi:hypothetical protein